MAEVRQTSFAAGELNRGLWGRSDLEVYRHGLRRCRNFIVSKMGALRTRPGMRFVREVLAGATKARMVGLQVSDTESYLILFTNVGIHIINVGILISSTNTQTSTVISSPYKADEIDELTFARSGRSLLIFSPKRRVYRLFIKSLSDVSLDEYLSTVVPAPPQLKIGIKRPRLPQEPFALLEAIAQGEPLSIYDKIRKAWFYSVVLSENRTGEIVHTTWWPIRKVVDWDEDDGEYKEIGDVVPYLAVSGEQPITIVAYGQQPNPPEGFSYEEIQIFRRMGVGEDPFDLNPSEDNVGGWVARISGRDWRFNAPGQAAKAIDRGADPDQFRHPRHPVHPLHLVYPRVGAYHEGRLLVANGAPLRDALPAFPEQIWCSEVGFYRHFDLHLFRVDSSAFSFKLGGPQSEEIRHLVSAGQLLILTDTAVYAIGEQLSALAIPQVRKQVNVGASWVQPIIVGSDVLFTTIHGSVFRMRYSWEHRTYLADDLSLTFGNPGVAAWCFAQEPLAVVWMARARSSAGRPFYSMTYVPELGSIGWAQHTTGIHTRLDGGVYEDQVFDLCALRYAGQDRVFALVERFIGTTTKLLIEEIGGEWFSDEVLLDSAINPGRAVPVPDDRKITINFRHLAGRDVAVVVRGLDTAEWTYLGTFPIQDGQVTFEVPSSIGNWVFWVAGLPFEAEIELLDLPLEKLRAKTVKKVGIEVQGARGVYVGESRETMTEATVRHVTDGFGPPKPGDGVIEVLISSSWNKHGRVVLQQRAPYAVTVRGVTREVNLGG